MTTLPRHAWLDFLKALLVALALVSSPAGAQAMKPGDDEGPLTAKLADGTITEVPAPDRAGDDWPCFLGPKGTGECSETQWLKKWPEGGPPVVWQKRIGTGYSAPSAMGNRLVVYHRPRDQDIIECLRADTGEVLWKATYPSRFTDPYGYNNGPRCTPLLTKSRCYTLNPEGKLFCLDLVSGQQIWAKDCSKEFKIPETFFGVGCTPILEGDLLIVLVGGQPNSGVVAFKADTGDVIWQNVGKSTWDGAATGDSDQPRYRWTGDESLVSYSTPIAATIHGQRHILCLMRQGFVSLDPNDGSLNFKYWFRPTVHESVNAARPVVIGDKIFLSAAYRLGSVLLQVQPSGKEVKVVWKDSRNMLTHWSTAIHVNSFLYGFSGRHEEEGALRCLDVKSGRVQWETTGYEGDVSKFSQSPMTGEIKDTATGKVIPFPFFGRGSKIQLGDRFLVLGERGTLALIKVNSEKFEEFGRASYSGIRYPSWAAPVLSRGRVYLRSETNLVCLDAAK
jgi:outer membrane protein assembly factor BamB